jgi:hypothetical protein
MSSDDEHREPSAE